MYGETKRAVTVQDLLFANRNKTTDRTSQHCHAQRTFPYFRVTAVPLDHDVVLLAFRRTEMPSSAAVSEGITNIRNVGKYSTITTYRVSGTRSFSQSQPTPQNRQDGDQPMANQALNNISLLWNRKVHHLVSNSPILDALPSQ